MSAESQIQGKEKKKHTTREVLALQLKCFRSLIQSVSLVMLILFTQLVVDGLKKGPPHLVATAVGCTQGYRHAGLKKQPVCRRRP